MSVSRQPTVTSAPARFKPTPGKPHAASVDVAEPYDSTIAHREYKPSSDLFLAVGVRDDPRAPCAATEIMDETDLNYFLAVSGIEGKPFVLPGTNIPVDYVCRLGRDGEYLDSSNSVTGVVWPHPQTPADAASAAYALPSTVAEPPQLDTFTHSDAFAPGVFGEPEEAQEEPFGPDIGKTFDGGAPGFESDNAEPFESEEQPIGGYESEEQPIGDYVNEEQPIGESFESVPPDEGVGEEEYGPTAPDEDWLRANASYDNDDEEQHSNRLFDQVVGTRQCMRRW